MDYLWYALSAIIGLGIGVAIIKFLDKQRKSDAHSEAQKILKDAEREAANLIRESELEAKEKSLQEKTRIEAELSKTRDELRARERGLDKRQEAIEQQGEDVRKQERIVETNQRKLVERLEETKVQESEFTRLIDRQRSKLHELSGMNKEEAERRLLTIVEKDLEQEIGALILKHEKVVAE
ncbi:MAG: ribonuclease Y, partial [Pirellulaceae bacterium]